MSQPETWETEEKIRGALLRFEAEVPGWTQPFAHGAVLVPEQDLGSSAVRFPVVNVGAHSHSLPAVVMGSVVGRVDESATFEVSPAQLDRAIELLAPAEAATMFRHPNLMAWRRIRNAWRSKPSGRIFTVFIADLEDPSSGPYDEALREQIDAGECAPIRA